MVARRSTTQAQLGKALHNVVPYARRMDERRDARPAPAP